jgi:hypothetical protein
MAKGSTYLGYYLGINKAGRVQRVDERSTGSGIELSLMDDEGISHPHFVLKGRQARTEVVIAYCLREVEYVSATMAGGEYEKRLRDRIEATATERGKQAD